MNGLFYYPHMNIQCGFATASKQHVFYPEENKQIQFSLSFHHPTEKKINKVLKVLAIELLSPVWKKMAKYLFKLILNDE